MSFVERRWIPAFAGMTIHIGGALMFADKQAAKIMLDHAFEVSRMLNLSLMDTQSLATSEEFSAAKQSIGKCMAEVLFEVINPIIKQHPELAPPDWHR